MTATQTQIRRDSATNLNAATPASGELGWDTTNKRLRGGDGSTAGGIYIPNRFDIQGQTFLAVDSGGAANVQTMTLGTGLVPTAYAKYQRFVFKAGFTNSGSATMNVNALGAKTIKKMSTAGPIALTGGEIYAGQTYAIVYDGTDFLLESVPVTSTTSGLVLLGTATASASATLDFTSLISATYKSYKWVLDDLRPATDNVDLWFRTSTNNGSSYDTGASDYKSVILGNTTGNWNSYATATITRNAADTKCILAIGVGNAAAECARGYINMIAPLGTAAAKMYSGRVDWFDATTQWLTSNDLAGGRNATADVDAVRFLFSSGNITSGSIRMYGELA